MYKILPWIIVLALTVICWSVDAARKQSEYLDCLHLFFKVDDGNINPNKGHRISVWDETWEDWLERTNEMPPDFSSLSSSPLLPDPFAQIQHPSKRVQNLSEWEEQRKQIKEVLQYWITGHAPPAPNQIQFMEQGEIVDEEGFTHRRVAICFGPENKAQLRVELIVPKGEGPFPVLLTQSNHESWALAAARRGYIGCLYAGCDRNDDTEAWMEIYPEYDFTRLMRRAWGAHRTVDYLYSLSMVDREKIAITGHSRNGKQSLWAAAFDERITACIPASGGTGGEIPFRYAREKYKVETIKVITARTRSWLHPRMRFFVGNENALPFDQHFFMALIAPRALMLSSAYNEPYGNPWGIDQALKQTKKVYQFLHAEDQLCIRLRPGGHGVSEEEFQRYLDFLDYVFGRSSTPVEPTCLFPYTYEDWKHESTESLPPKIKQHCAKAVSPVKFTTSLAAWEKQKHTALEMIRWSLGSPEEHLDFHIDKQSGMSVRTGESHPDTPESKTLYLSSPNGEQDFPFEYTLYLPSSKTTRGEPYPVMIYLHEYSYASGWSKAWPHTNSFSVQHLLDRGIAVVQFDMMGFGSRIHEGTRFYERHPHWSKMGKLVWDVRHAVSLLGHLDFIDSNQIYVGGFSLGAITALFSTALDNRIAGVSACAGVYPFDLVQGNEIHPVLLEWIQLHGLLPRLGLCLENDRHLPYNYEDILACIAPRKMQLICPRYDQDLSINALNRLMDRAEAHYDLYDQKSNFVCSTPKYYDQLIPKRINETIAWIGNCLDKP